MNVELKLIFDWDWAFFHYINPGNRWPHKGYSGSLVFIKHFEGGSVQFVGCSAKHTKQVQVVVCERWAACSYDSISDTNKLHLPGWHQQTPQQWLAAQHLGYKQGRFLSSLHFPLKLGIKRLLWNTKCFEQISG